MDERAGDEVAGKNEEPSGPCWDGNRVRGDGEASRDGTGLRRHPQ